MIDEAGRRLIEARNGLGASKQLSPEDQQLLAHMQTNRQGRAVLGAIAQYLKKGYEIASGVGGVLPGTKDLSAAMKSRLDTTNRYAQKTYAGLPDDNAPLTPLNRRRIEECLREARVSLTEISTDADDMNRGLTGTLADMLTGQLPPWLRPKDPKTRDLILKIGLGILGLTALYIAGKLVTKIVLRGAGAVHRGALGAAETAAVALMDAQRRRRRAARRSS